MIAVVAPMRVWVAVEPVDFRNGVDGLVAGCRQRLQAEPMSGALFVFRSRRARSLKILAYDGQGFLLCQKRLSAGRFSWWPAAGGAAAVRLEAAQMQLLLWNGDPTRAATAPLWRPLPE
jgi:transposase